MTQVSEVYQDDQDNPVFSEKEVNPVFQAFQALKERQLFLDNQENVETQEYQVLYKINFLFCYYKINIVTIIFLNDSFLNFKLCSTSSAQLDTWKFLFYPS